MVLVKVLLQRSNWARLVRFFIAIIVLALILFLSPINRSRRIDPRTNLAVALHSFLYKYGHYPSDSRGEDFALYNLRDSVDVSVFKYSDDSNPYWDDKPKRLVGSDFYYRNEPMRDSQEFLKMTTSYSPILMASKPTFDRSQVALVCGNGVVSYKQFIKHPREKLVAMFLTDDDFVAANEDIAKKWGETHSGVLWHKSVWSNDGIQYSSQQKNQRGRLDYSYDKSGRLVECIIHVGYGAIIEKVLTDKSGILIGVERKPSDWRRIFKVVEDNQPEKHARN